MSEQLYLDLIEEMTRIKDIGGGVVEPKTYEDGKKIINYSVQSTRIDDIRIRIDHAVLVYTNGVYSSVDTAVYAGMSLTEIKNQENYYVPEGISQDLKDTIDAAVMEFYKFNTKI